MEKNKTYRLVYNKYLERNSSPYGATISQVKRYTASEKGEFK